MSGKWNSDFKMSPTPGTFDMDHRSLIFWLAILAGLVFCLSIFMGLGGFQNPFRSRKSVRIVQSDQRSIALALESYYVDHKSYPAWAIGMYGVNNKLRASDPAFAMPTFMIRSANRPRLATLTTPVAYLSDYVSVTDPYAPTKGAHYGYWTDGKGWILYSAGPDETYDIVPSQDYTPGLPTKASLIHKTYDATNGSRSRGDIWKVKQ